MIKAIAEYFRQRHIQKIVLKQALKVQKECAKKGYKTKTVYAAAVFVDPPVKYPEPEGDVHYVVDVFSGQFIPEEIDCRGEYDIYPGYSDDEVARIVDEMLDDYEEEQALKLLGSD